MQLPKGKTSLAAKTGMTTVKKAALAIGASLMMASGLASAAAIDGVEQGFAGWYAPQYWSFDYEADASATITSDRLSMQANSGQVIASILMPENDQFDVAAWLTGTVAVGGAFYAVVDYQEGVTWNRMGTQRDAGIPFAAGELFRIKLTGGTLDVTEFTGPAVDRPASVPEPGALALLGLGLVGLGATQIRRNRK